MLSSELQDVQVSETQVLVLNFMKNDPKLPEFLEMAKKLKVLIVTNYGFYLSELHSFHIVQYLTNLKTMRLERVFVPSFASIELQNLQKLTFFMCNVRKAFSSLNVSKSFPNLEEMHINYCGDLVNLPDGVQDSAKMKTLSVTHCHKLSKLPDEIGRMSGLEIVRLRSCIALTDLPASFCDLARVRFVDLSECFSIKDLPEDIGNLSCLEKLNMKGCSRIQSLPASVLDFQTLLEVVCDEDIKELWEFHLPNDSEIQLTLASEDINLNFL
jgi:Leucine-rich repeat (LRR) protein